MGAFPRLTGLRAELVIYSSHNVVLSRIPIGNGELSGMTQVVNVAVAAQDAAVAGVIRPLDPPLTEARAGWKRDMERRGCKPSSVKSFLRILDACCAGVGWQTVGSVTLAGAMEWLAHQREHGWSGTTTDHGVSGLRCFGDYLRKAGLTTVNVLQDLETSGEVGEEGARALTLEEARAMIRVARERESQDRRAKGNRALYYCFLCLTGLRSAEAAKCRWRDVHLGAEKGAGVRASAPSPKASPSGDSSTVDSIPMILTDPRWSKNGRRQRVVLNSEIAGLLREHRRAVDSRPDAKVFPTVPNRHTWHDTRERAGIPPDDDRGRSCTMHGCRKFFASALDRAGASPGVVARLLRHADGITQARYIDPQIEEEIAAVEKIPPLWPAPGNHGRSGPSGPVDNPKVGADNGNGSLTGARGTDRVSLSHSRISVPNVPDNSAPEARAADGRSNVTVQGTPEARASGVELTTCPVCCDRPGWVTGCCRCGGVGRVPKYSPKVESGSAHYGPQSAAHSPDKQDRGAGVAQLGRALPGTDNYGFGRGPVAPTEVPGSNPGAGPSLFLADLIEAQAHRDLALVAALRAGGGA